MLLTCSFCKKSRYSFSKGKDIANLKIMNLNSDYNYNIVVFDMLGRQILSTKKHSDVNGSINLQIDNYKFVKGVYNIILVDDKGSINSIKFIND